MPTYQTRLPETLDPFLEEMALLYSQIEKDMHVGLNNGLKISELEKSLQLEYGVDSTTVRNVYHNLKGKHQSIRELQKTQLKDLKATISSISKSISQYQKKIEKKNQKNQSTTKERFIIHQKQRRLTIKQQKLARLSAKIRAKKVSICFGKKKLFLAQYHLKENGYSNHEQWLEDWKQARSSNFLMVGSKTYLTGNQLCRLTRNGNLTITVPPCLISEFGSHVSLSGINFRYGQQYIDLASYPTKHQRGQQIRNGTEKPVTHRFVKKDRQWYLHTSVELPDIPTISQHNNGAVGIDLNADNIAWAYCNGEGNLKQTGQINFNLSNLSSGQITNIISRAISQIIAIAIKYECPIIIEKLDFSRKKASVREQSKRSAKMLSGFAYAKFSELVKSKSYRAGIETRDVNPAYSSLIGLTKYMSLYGLNSGTAAALVLARRGLRFSERMPRILYAFVSPVDDTKHVWSYWARISKMLRGCQRHSFFGMRVRVGVKSSGSKPPDKSTLDTPIIPSSITALDIMST